MHRQQVSAMETWPLSNLDNKDDSNQEPQDKRNANNASTSEQKPKKKKIYEDEEDEDEQPVKEENPITNRDLLMYYAKNSTMHGVPTIVGSELYRGRHIFWSCVVCVMAFLLGTVVYFQLSNYYDYPTVTSVDIRYVNENDFPSVTFCNLNYFDGFLVSNTTNRFTAFYLSQLTEITGFYHRFSGKMLRQRVPSPSNESSDMYIQNLMNETTRKILASRLYCSWGEYYWSQCPASRIRVTEMGICVTIDVRALAKKRPKNVTADDESGSLPAVGNALRGLTFYVDVSSHEIPERIYQYQGFKAVLHDADEEPLPLSSGFLVTGDTTVEVEVSKIVKMGLPFPYKAFGSGTCVNTHTASFVNPLKRFQNYSKEVCEAECFINFVVEECGGCRHFLHPGNESLCPVGHLAKCYRAAERHYYSGQVDRGKHRDGCRCPMPCIQTTYQASVTTAPFNATKLFTDIQKEKNITLNHTIAYIHVFYSDPVVSEMRQVAVYSTEGLLGNIGGQIGLFMGFSLITVAEMLELIFLLVTRGRNLDERVKRHKKSEKAAQSMQA